MDLVFFFSNSCTGIKSPTWLRLKVWLWCSMALCRQKENLKKKNAKSHLFSLQGWHAVIYFNHLCSTNSSYRQSEKNNSNNLRENNKKLSIGWLCKVKYKPLVPWMQMKRLDFSIQQVHVSTQSSDHVLIKGEFEKVKFRLSCRNNKSWFCEPSLNVESLKPHRINAKIKPRSGSGSVSWSDTRLENHSSVE